MHPFGTTAGVIRVKLRFCLFLGEEQKAMAGYRENDPHFATKALHVGQEPEQWNSMAVVPPISLATTFKQEGPADFKK